MEWIYLSRFQTEEILSSSVLNTFSNFWTKNDDSFSSTYWLLFRKKDRAKFYLTHNYAVCMMHSMLTSIWMIAFQYKIYYYIHFNMEWPMFFNGDRICWKKSFVLQIIDLFSLSLVIITICALCIHKAI